MEHLETKRAIRQFRRYAHFNIFVAALLFAWAVGIGYVSIKFLFVVFTSKSIGEIAIGIGVAIFLLLVVARLIILALWRYQVGASANDLADGIESCPINHEEDRGTP